MKFFYHPQKRTFTNVIIIMVMCIFLLYTFYLLPKKSFAEEVFLYPAVCTGTWSKSETVTGQDFTASGRGAHSSAVGDELSCRNFSGDVPSEIEILSATLEFIWGERTTESTPLPSIEESYDLKPADSSPSLPAVETKKLDVEDMESVESVNEPPTNTDQEMPQNFELEKSDPEPVSWLPSLRSLGVIEAKAEEIETGDVEVKTTPLQNLENQTKIEETTKVDSSLEEKIESPVEQKIITDVETANPEKIDITDSSIILSEEMPETTSQAIEATSVSENTTGTALFDITYQLDNSPPQVLGSLYQESLSEKIPIPLQFNDIDRLVVTIKSRLTLDSTEHLVLQGIRLSLTYSFLESTDDPFPQPDLTRDTVLDDIITENIEIIRIKRNKTKAHEIWYRYLTAEDKIELKDLEPEDLEVIENNDSNPLSEDKIELKDLDAEDPEVIANDDSHSFSEENRVIDSGIHIPPIPKTLTLDSEALITDTTQTSLEQKAVEEQLISQTKKIILKTKNNTARLYDWNFVAGGKLVHEILPVALHDGNIFWFNAQGNALYAFSILTQGINSQSFSPEDETVSIFYFGLAREEKKAEYNQQNSTFNFFDEAL